LFVSAVERLFIDSGEDLDAALLLDDTSDVVDDFEPQIIRK
jgi:hypothetical protein